MSIGEAEDELVEESKDFAKEKGIPLEKEPSEAQQAELFRVVILPNIGRQAEEIAALTPPVGDEGTIEDLKAYGFKVCGS